MKPLITNALHFACLAAMLLTGLILYADLPGSIPIQYGVDGTPQNSLPKVVTVLITPLIYAASIAATKGLMRYSPAEFSMPNSKHAMDVVLLGIGLLLLASHIGILRSVGNTSVFLQYFSVGLALFLLVTGNVFGKTERNFFVGIRLPWTIASMGNWRATHRFAGRLMVISGILLLAVSFYSPSLTLTLVLGFNWAILAIGYSFLYSLKNGRAE